MGIPTLIATLTADGDSSLTDTSSMTSTYDEYMFVFTDINPATDDQQFQFQVNASSQSGYNETMTTTSFQAYHKEDASAAAVSYNDDHDQAQATSYHSLTNGIGNGSDESAAGILHIFSPASTTYVTHFYARANTYYSGDNSTDWFSAGYVNVTAAIDEISFKVESGNFDGVIQIYGIS